MTLSFTVRKYFNITHHQYNLFTITQQERLKAEEEERKKQEEQRRIQMEQQQHEEELRAQRQREEAALAEQQKYSQYQNQIQTRDQVPSPASTTVYPSAPPPAYEAVAGDNAQLPGSAQ